MNRAKGLYKSSRNMSLKYRYSCIFARPGDTDSTHPWSKWENHRRKFEYWRSNNIEGAVRYPSQPWMQFSKSTYMHGQPLRQLVSHIFTDTSMRVGVEVDWKRGGKAGEFTPVNDDCEDKREERKARMYVTSIMIWPFLHREQKREGDLCGCILRSSTKGQ